jgi:hypothetical protein
MFGSARMARRYSCSNIDPDEQLEISMYIGGGVLGTILLLALIVFLVRRA